VSSTVFFADNVLERATSVTADQAAAGKPVTRVYDRERSLPWAGTSAIQQSILVDMGAAGTPVSAFALVDHNFPIGAIVTLLRGSSSPASVSTTTMTIASNPQYLALSGIFTERHWRLQIPALSGSVIPQLGEFMLGVPQIPTMPPTIERIRATNRSNVRRDESPAGYSWAVRRGARRDRFSIGWNYTTLAAERTAILTAIQQTLDTSKKLLWVDDYGTPRWVNWLTTDLQLTPHFDEIWQVEEIVLEDAL
jgi:hypothetical protein